jgi:hypothetical protein
VANSIGRRNTADGEALRWLFVSGVALTIRVVFRCGRPVGQRCAGGVPSIGLAPLSRRYLSSESVRGPVCGPAKRQPLADRQLQYLNLGEEMVTHVNGDDGAWR